MSLPVPRRRARNYDPARAYKQTNVVMPIALAARLREQARAEKKPEKALILEAIEAKLPVPRASKPADESADE